MLLGTTSFSGNSGKILPESKCQRTTLWPSIFFSSVPQSKHIFLTGALSLDCHVLINMSRNRRTQGWKNFPDFSLMSAMCKGQVVLISQGRIVSSVYKTCWQWSRYHSSWMSFSQQPGWSTYTWETKKATLKSMHFSFQTVLLWI